MSGLDFIKTFKDIPQILLITGKKEYAADAFDYDIILMDIQMQEVDGYAATNCIRERLNIKIPIVAVTAHSAKGEREKCLELGMNDYLTKPYRAQELYNVIVRHTHCSASFKIHFCISRIKCT